MEVKRLCTSILKDQYVKQPVFSYIEMPDWEHGKVAVLYEKAALMLIDAGWFPFDIAKLQKNVASLEARTVEQLLKPGREMAASSAGVGTKAYLTGIIRKMERLGDVLEVKNKREEATWIPAGQLKFFDATAAFRFEDPRHPVFIYERDKLAGLIMPVRRLP